MCNVCLRAVVDATFGVPLEEVLVTRGVVSNQGPSNHPMRIPRFVDDCISSMRAKGKHGLSSASPRAMVTCQFSERTLARVPLPCPLHACGLFPCPCTDLTTIACTPHAQI